MSYVGLWRKGIPSRRISKYKGPGAGVSPVCSETIFATGLEEMGGGGETGKRWDQKMIRDQTTQGPHTAVALL